MPIPSNERTYGAYMVESSGILGILTVISILCKHYSITQGAIILGCDGLSALQRIVLKIKERYSPNRKHNEIISLALYLKAILPIEIKVTQILGHQDEYVAFENLTRLEQMNIIMDAVAKYVVR